MKKHILTLAATMLLCGGAAALLLATPAHAQTSTPSNMTKDELFAGTEKFGKGATSATEIDMGPESLGMVGGKEAPRAHQTLLKVVRSYSYDKPGMYNIAEVEEFRNKLNSGEWHCSLHTRDSKNNTSTDICNKHRTDDLTEKAIISVEPRQLTFIHTITRGGGGGFGPGAMLIGPDAALSYALPMLGTESLISQAELQANLAELQANTSAFTSELGPHLHKLSPDAAVTIHRLRSDEDARKALRESHKEAEHADAPQQ